MLEEFKAGEGGEPGSFQKRQASSRVGRELQQVREDQLQRAQSNLRKISFNSILICENKLRGSLRVLLGQDLSSQALRQLFLEINYFHPNFQKMKNKCEELFINKIIEIFGDKERGALINFLLILFLNRSSLQ